MGKRERQLGLFPYPVMTEEVLEGIVSPLYPALWRMIREPFDDLVVRRASDAAFRILDEGETAWWMRPQIAERARELFKGHPDVSVEKQDGQFFLKYKQDLAIVPKKLKLRRHRLTFSSYPTHQNMAFWEQQAISGLPDMPRLIVGYQFIAEMTDINIWVAYPRGRWLGTCFLMPDQTGAIKGVFQPPAEEAPEDQDKGFRVKPKKKDAGEIG
jgi:hypothetical protein